MIKKLLFNLLIIISLFFFNRGGVFAQPTFGSPPETKLGEIRFQIREVGPSACQFKMLEIQIEVLNRSSRVTAPPHSIKVLVTPKEIKFPEGSSVTEFNLKPEEVSIDLPLPPSTGRIVTIGHQLPEKKPESITFEIQMNPPDGEKKTVTWEGSRN